MRVEGPAPYCAHAVFPGRSSMDRESAAHARRYHRIAIEQAPWRLADEFMADEGARFRRFSGRNQGTTGVMPTPKGGGGSDDELTWSHNCVGGRQCGFALRKFSVLGVSISVSGATRPMG